MKPAGIGTRQDHTSGKFRITISPLNDANEIAKRLSADGGFWQIEQNHVGGNGDATQAIERDTREAVNLWRDARGGWWIQMQLRPGMWIPDIERTISLVRPARQDEPAACGNECASNVRDMRYPNW